MARLLKERELDQSMWEAGNFALADAETALGHIEGLHKRATENAGNAAAIDASAAEREGTARAHLVDAEQALHDARMELKEAHEQRIATKRLHVDANACEEDMAKTVKILRLHVHRTRAASVDWAKAKGFENDMLPELDLMSKGGLNRLIADRRRHLPDERDAEMSASEAEAM